MKKFFVFQIKPKGSYRSWPCWLYAENDIDARATVDRRLSESYPNGCEVLPQLKVFVDPIQANNNSPSGLMSALTPADKRDFIEDFLKWREENPHTPGRPNTLDLDVDNERRLMARELQRLQIGSRR